MSKKDDDEAVARMWALKIAKAERAVAEAQGELDHVRKLYKRERRKEQQQNAQAPKP